MLNIHISSSSMLPAKCYCFSVGKINAAISLECVTNAIDIVNKLHAVGSGRRRFHSRMTDESALSSRTLSK